MGSLYRSQHELICLFRVPGDKNRNNIELGKHGRNRSNVWNYPSALSFGRSSVEGDLLKDHPPPKPKENYRHPSASYRLKPPPRPNNFEKIL